MIFLKFSLHIKLTEKKVDLNIWCICFWIIAQTLFMRHVLQLMYIEATDYVFVWSAMHDYTAYICQTYVEGPHGIFWTGVICRTECSGVLIIVIIYIELFSACIYSRTLLLVSFWYSFTCGCDIGISFILNF